MSGRINDKWLQTMVKKHGSLEAVTELMKVRGKKGGHNSTTGGFFANRELARIAGAKGGRISKPNTRAKVVVKYKVCTCTIDNMYPQNDLSIGKVLVNKGYKLCDNCGGLVSKLKDAEWNERYGIHEETWNDIDNA